MLNLKYKIGDVFLDEETNKFWIAVYYDEETCLYNIQEINVKQVSESKLNEMILLDDDDLKE